MIPSPKDEVVETFPATATQARCWFLDRMNPGETGLNVAERWDIRGTVISADIEAALGILIDRHEALRTRFREQDGVPVQDVVRGVDFKLGMVDIRNLPPDQHAARIEAIAREQAAQPFDMRQAGLIRVNMIRVAPDRAMLLLVVHQSVCDGYSIGLLGHELGLIASALAEGRTPELPDLPLQFGDFALWQREYLACGVLDEDAAYWKRQLAGAPYFELQPDRPRPRLRSSASAALDMDLPPDFMARVDRAARGMEVSPFVFGTAVLSAALHRFTGAEDVLFGTQIAGRNDVDLENVVGVFTNNLVLRLATAPDDTIQTMIERARTAVTGAMTHQAIPFDRLVAVLNPPRDTSRIPLISVNFVMREEFTKDRDYGRFRLAAAPAHTPGTFYDLNVALIGRGADWKLAIDYAEALFDKSTIAAFRDVLLAAFETAMADPARLLGTIPFAERPLPRAAAKAAPPAREEGPAPVRDKTRARLATLWAEMLEIPPEHCDGDFFEIGGHSILVLRMLLRIEDDFGVRLGVSAFLAEPTLRGVARQIEAGSRRAADTSAAAGGTWNLFTLRAGAVDGPVVLTVNQPILYHKLARYFRTDCTVASLNIPTAEALAGVGRMGFDAAVADAADRVADAFGGRRLVLCGLCVDGLVALRLAQELSSRGRAVAQTVLIDSWRPDVQDNLPLLTRIGQTWSTRFRRWRHLASLKARGDLGWRDFALNFNALAAPMRRLSLADPETDEARHMRDVTRELVRITDPYPFRPFDGEVLLFKSTASDALAVDMMFGWAGTLREDTPLFAIRGWHQDALLGSGFERLAQVIDRKLESARAAQA